MNSINIIWELDRNADLWCHPDGLNENLFLFVCFDFKILFLIMRHSDLLGTAVGGSPPSCFSYERTSCCIFYSAFIHHLLSSISFTVILLSSFALSELHSTTAPAHWFRGKPLSSLS